MTQFEQDVIERLTKLNAKLEEVQKALSKDYKALHGNGHPGLIERVTLLEHNWGWIKWLAGIIGAGIGIVATNLKDWIK